MIKITIVSTKGGVGKTTLTANLGGILADAGYRVLLIDADQQPTLSSYFNLAYRSPEGLTHFLVNSTIDRAVSRTSIENLEIIVSDDPMGKLRDWIRDTPDGRVRMKYILDKPGLGYDFVLIDTQGAAGPIQEAAVAAADFMISPIPPEMLSAREFIRGTLDLIKRLEPMARLGAPIGPLKGVICKMDRTVDARNIVEQLRLEFPKNSTISIIETVIPQSVVYREAATYKVPVHHLEKKGTQQTARALMMQLAQELIPNLPEFLFES